MIALTLCLAALPLAANAEDFMGYPCTQDCSGHEAGYAWAQDKGVSDPNDCSGNSNSFVEGCRAAAQEQEQTDDFEAREEADDAREGRWY